MEVVRSFTTAAYYPRTDSRSVQYRDAKLDIAYAIHSNEPDIAPPEADKLNILFLHGATFIKEGWNYWIKLCYKEWGSKLGKCIAMDHVHHGDSALLNRSKVGFFIPWEDEGRDAACVIRDCIKRGEIHPSAPLIVIAHSMSGSAAVALSVFDPGLVSALVLVDPVWMGTKIGLGDVDRVNGTFARMSLSAYKRGQDTFETTEEYEEYVTKNSIYANLPPAITEDLLKALAVKCSDGKIRMKTPAVFQAGGYYAALSAAGMGDSMVKRVRAPTFLVHGDIHDFNPPGSNESLQKRLPHAYRKVVPGGAHLVCFTHPEETFDAVKDFITQQCENHIAHVRSVDRSWGKTAEERYFEQINLQAKGNYPAGFSKL